jgi:superfamily I DNA and RNA helicase
MTEKTRQGLSRFITTEAIENEYQDSYQKVWDAVKTAFSPRNNCIGYWRYPLFLEVHNKRQEPDILMVDQEWGIIIINVCLASLNDIISLDNKTLKFTENFTQFNPNLESYYQYNQVLNGYCQENSLLNNQVISKNLIVFPNIISHELQAKIYTGSEEGSSFIFNNQFGEVTLRNRIEKAQPVINGNSLDETQYQELLSIISGTYLLRKQFNNIPKHEGKTRANTLIESQNLMYEWDVKQEWIGKSVPPGPQRVRGIAGSGKTILFAQKTVIMHLKHPDWKIAFVFFTRSLYDQIETLVKLWLHHFTNGEIEYNSDFNLKILHAWGAKNRNGFYRLICKVNKQNPLSVKETSEKNAHRRLADVCIKLQKTTKIRPVFDAIIIDEGQDFITENDLKLSFKNGDHKQAIYWLAYQSLKPVNSENTSQKRLIWAYDEAQTIHSAASVAPEAKEIFGVELSGMLGGLGGGIYKGDIRKGYDLERCYRTPDLILTSAYALGLGLWRSGGIIRPDRLRKKDLQAIGFEVEGDFRKKNEPITIKRPVENSPNPISQLWDHSLIEFHKYKERKDELAALVEQIKRNLIEDKLNPSRNILIIVLGDKNLEIETANFLLDSGLDVYISGAEKLNCTNSKSLNQNPDQFWCDRAITITSINRAKGNEADFVYLIALDNIAKNEANPTFRNQLFVALTRSRGWVNLSGIGNYPFYNEVENVIKQGNNFTFTLTGTNTPEDTNEELSEDSQL